MSFTASKYIGIALLGGLLSGCSLEATMKNLLSINDDVKISGPQVQRGNNTASFTWAVLYKDGLDIQLTDAHISSLMGGDVHSCVKSVSTSGNPRTVTLTGCQGNGSLGIRLGAGSALHVDRPVEGADGNSAQVDNQPPDILISNSTVTSGGVGSSFSWSVDFQDAEVSSISFLPTLIGTATDNCTVVVSQGDSPRKRNITVTGCTGNGTLGIRIPSGAAADDVGNLSAQIDSATLVNVVNASPVVNIANPKPLIGNKDTVFAWVLTYDQPQSITLTVDDIELVGDTNGCVTSIVSVSSAVRRVEVTGCSSEGSIELLLAAGTGKNLSGVDYEGNEGGSVAIDNTPPTISLGSVAPVTGDLGTVFKWTVSYTGASRVGLAAANVILTGKSEGCFVTVSGAGLATREISVSQCEQIGSFTLGLEAGTANDQAGNLAPSVVSASAVTLSNKFMASFESSSEVVAKGTAAGATQSFNVKLNEPAPEDIEVGLQVLGNKTTLDLGSLTFPSTVTIPAGQQSVTVSYQYDGSVAGSKVLQAAIYKVRAPAVAVTTGKNNFTRQLIRDASGGAGFYKKVDVGSSYSCAIRFDDQLECWGQNTYGQLGTGVTTESSKPTLVVGGETYLDVDVSTSHTCALRADKKIACWGYGAHGRLGNGQTTNRTTPTLITSTETYKSVAVGLDHTCALREDGLVECWGNGISGQLGKSGVTQSLTPVLVDGGAKYTEISLSSQVACALREDRKIDCWGSDASGRLGTGTTGNKFSPTAVQSDEEYLQVAAGGQAVCALRAVDQKIDCWGVGTSGTLGHGVVTNQFVPTLIMGNQKYKKISLDTQQACALRIDDRLECWGVSHNGILGDSISVVSPFPIFVNPKESYKDISVGQYYACGIRQDDGLDCWGASASNGNGQNSGVVAPTAITGGRDYIQVSAGGGSVCAINENQKVECWGANTDGQLGNGSKFKTAAPMQIASDANYLAVSVGATHTCALRDDKKIQCWGSGDRGQLGNDALLGSTVPVLVSGGRSYQAVSAGTNISCGLREDYLVDCWGAGSSAAFGAGVGTTKRVPTAISSSYLFSSVDASGSMACGILASDSTVLCWGGSTASIFAQGSSPSQAYLSASVGGNMACLIRDDQKAECWGGLNSILGDTEGTTDTNVPLPVLTPDSYSAVSVGGGVTCALRLDGQVACWGQGGSYSMLGNGYSYTTAVYLPGLVAGGGIFSAVSVGSRAACALGVDQKIQCWGYLESIGDGSRTMIPLVVTP